MAFVILIQIIGYIIFFFGGQQVNNVRENITIAYGTKLNPVKNELKFYLSKSQSIN